jgi:LmbE family N-acetylglucosaminyl deacetylase
MTIPPVSETEWLGVLRDLPMFPPSTKPILIIAPHPDDETLAIGGFIAAQCARGIDVQVVAVTDGENAYPDTPGLGGLRRAEQERALVRLGVPSENRICFELPDSGVASREQELIELLLGLVSQDTHIVAPWRGDFHPDHEACGRAAEYVANWTGAALSSYFFWTWHRAQIDSLTHLRLRSFALNDLWLAAKTDALGHHRSQLVRDAGDPILPESLLGPARRSFEVFAVS